MKNSSEGIRELRAKAEVSINKAAHIQQVLAQAEANPSRKENQVVSEKSKNQ